MAPAAVRCTFASPGSPESHTTASPCPERLRPTAPWLVGEEGFRLLVDVIEDYAVYLLDAEGRVLTWNIGAQNWRVRKDGTRFWANVVITALRDEEGQLAGFVKITRDLSERRRHEEALRQSEEKFRPLVDSVRDHAMIMLDPQGRIESWNSGAVAITGYAAGEVLGRHFSLFHTPQDVAAGNPQRELALALSQRRVDDEGWRLRKDGSMFWGGISFRDVALRSAEAARPLMEARQHHLTLDVPDDAVELVGDDARLVQLLQNLLSNAAKYTDSGGDIRLQVRVEDGDVVSVVSDNGCGIAPEALERIFDLFAQEEGAGAAAESGLGIGLTLCRNVAEMHGGIAARRERRQPLHAPPAHHAIAGGGRRGGRRCGDSAHAARPEHAGGQWLRRAAAPARAADAATALCGGDDGLRPRGRPREDAGRRLRCPPDQAGGCGAAARDAGACRAGRRIESSAPPARSSTG